MDDHQRCALPLPDSVLLCQEDPHLKGLSSKLVPLLSSPFLHSLSPLLPKGRQGTVEGVDVGPGPERGDLTVGPHESTSAHSLPLTSTPDLPPY